MQWKLLRRLIQPTRFYVQSTRRKRWPLTLRIKIRKWGLQGAWLKWNQRQKSMSWKTDTQVTSSWLAAPSTHTTDNNRNATPQHCAQLEGCTLYSIEFHATHRLCSRLECWLQCRAVLGEEGVRTVRSGVGLSGRRSTTPLDALVSIGERVRRMFGLWNGTTRFITMYDIVIRDWKYTQGVWLSLLVRDKYKVVNLFQMST